MHLLAGAHDGVDGAGGQAFHAADADVFVDLGHQWWALDAIRGI
jgi:hypothetical protein